MTTLPWDTVGELATRGSRKLREERQVADAEAEDTSNAVVAPEHGDLIVIRAAENHSINHRSAIGNR